MLVVAIRPIVWFTCVDGCPLSFEKIGQQLRVSVHGWVGRFFVEGHRTPALEYGTPKCQ
jgi:hypothetical protein